MAPGAVAFRCAFLPEVGVLAVRPTGARSWQLVRHSAPMMWDEMKLERSLLIAEVAAGWCVNDDYVCRWRVGVLIDICSSILHGDFSARLQQRALQALGWVAIAGRVDWADLRRIVLLCGQAAGRPHIAKGEVLSTLHQVARSPFLDAASAEAIVVAVVQVVDITGVFPRRPAELGLFVETISIITALAERISDDHGVCALFVYQVRRLATNRGVDEPPLSLRWVLVRMLQEVLPRINAVALLGEAIEAVDACARHAATPDIAGAAAEMLLVLARRVADAQLGRVLDVLRKASLGEHPDAAAALEVVADRLLGHSFGGEARARVRLLASVFELMHERSATPLPCGRCIRVLLDLEAPEPPSRAALRLGGAARPPPELLWRLDSELVPPTEEERDRSGIVALCAAGPGGARSALQAACLLPRRVGFEAARRLRALDLGPLGHEDFCEVGACLRRSAGLAEADAVGLEHVASELLEAAAPLAPGWPREQRSAALAHLCRLSGGLHRLCRHEAFF